MMSGGLAGGVSGEAGGSCAIPGGLAKQSISTASSTGSTTSSRRSCGLRARSDRIGVLSNHHWFVRRHVIANRGSRATVQVATKCVATWLRPQVTSPRTAAAWRLLQEAAAHGDDGGLGTIGDFELGEDTLHVLLGGGDTPAHP